MPEPRKRRTVASRKGNGADSARPGGAGRESAACWLAEPPGSNALDLCHKLEALGDKLDLIIRLLQQVAYNGTNRTSLVEEYVKGLQSRSRPYPMEEDGS